MALDYQKRMRESFIQSIYNEGYINDTFLQLQLKKDTGRPDDVVRAITLYSQAAQNLFIQMSFHMEQANVDFYQIEVHARDMYDRTSSIGAEQVKIACADIVLAAQEFDKNHCIRALNWTKSVFSKMRLNFETLIQIERKIMELESGI